MKAKYTIIMIAAGYCLDFVGSYVKILHWPGGEKLLLLAMLLKFTGVGWFAYKLVTYDGFKKFMNK